ncbi:ABC transporter permease [Dactylosporangium sp. CA-092794]|uniref:ABC transporter permease n=1 Tax=Dactylosporangium sp. CA-092794 TaxID=3239929 RepID=UPI003D8DFBD6
MTSTTATATATAVAGRLGGGLNIRLRQVLAVVVAIALWAAVCASGWISRDALPTPAQVADSLREAFATRGFWTDVGETLRGAVAGLLLAAVAGIPLGLVTGTFAAAERSSRLLVDILRSFPVIALLPVFLLVMGAKPEMKITVVFIACVFPIFLQAQYGARDVPPTIQETAHSFRIPRLLRFRKVVLPSATPSIMTGVRFAATTSVLVALGTELLSTLPGMGHTIAASQQNGNSPRAFAYIVAAGFVGWTINSVSERLERRLLRWRPPARGGA